MIHNGLRPGARSILRTMVWFETRRIPMPWSRTMIALPTGYKPLAGYFKEQVAILKEGGLISYPTKYHLALEHEGRLIAVPPKADLTLVEFHARVLLVFKPRPREILRKLIMEYPRKMRRKYFEIRNPGDRAVLASLITDLLHTRVVQLPDPESIVADPILFPKELIE